MASGVDILLSGYDPASDIYLSKKDISPLKNSQKESDRWLHKQFKRWMKLWKVFLGSEEGFIPFDAITMGSFLYPEWMSFSEEVSVVVRSRK